VNWKCGGIGVMFCNWNGFWDDGDFNSRTTDDDLTHWMPLPDTPQNKPA
jgi:hypothetical protein